MKVTKRLAALVAWRGSAQAELNRNPSTEEKQRRVDAAVKNVIPRFPPQ